MKKSGYSGSIKQSGTYGTVTVKGGSSRIVDTTKAETDLKLLSVTAVKSEPLSIMSSGSSSTIPPIDGADVFPYVRWFQTKDDLARICATWYTETSYRQYVSYIFYSSTDLANANWYSYFGDWDSTRVYTVGVLVRYGSRYYRCIRAHETAITPTNTTYWAVKAMPDLSGITNANANIAAAVPDSFDFVDELSIDSGDLYTTTKGSAYEGMYVAMSICTNWITEATIGDERKTYYFMSDAYHCLGAPISFERLNGTPTISYNSSSNQISVSSSLSGRYLMEFYRESYNPTIYNERIRNEFFLTSMPNLEYGYEGYYLINNQRLHKWRKNTSYTVGIHWLDTVNQSRIRNAITSALSDINSAMSGFGISFNLSGATTGDITITVGCHEDLYGSEASMDYWLNGTWDYSDHIDNEGYITHAEIKLTNDLCWHGTFEGTALEELLQCLGAGYDQTEYVQNTIHSEFSYLNKNDSIGSIDNGILQILYSDLVTPNMTAAQVSMAVNPTIGATVVTNGQTLSFLEPNTTYKVKVYVVNAWGYLSYPSTTLTITTPNNARPANWEWTTNIVQGGDLPYSSDIGYYVVTAAEWNNFTKRINQFRRYWAQKTGTTIPDYSFTTAVRGNDFTAAIYNEAVNAIKGISGYGTYLSTVNKGDNILASHFILLKNELNAIP